MDLELAYILISIDSSCKPMVRRTRFPKEVWEPLKYLYHSVSEATIDAKLSQLQSMTLEKGEKIIEFSSRIIGLVGELEKAGHDVSVVGKKGILLRGLPADFDVTSEAIMSTPHDFSQAVSKLIVRETRLKDLENSSEKAVTTSLLLGNRKCYFWGKKGQLLKIVIRK